MKKVSKDSFINVSKGVKKVEVIIDEFNYDTYAVVTPIKNIEIIEKNK
ncbi:hypothetical protein [Halalkalibacter flavus]